MTENHQKALEKLKNLHKDKPENIALIICGSVARGDARDDSDIDLYLVVTDNEFLKVSRDTSYFYGTWDPEAFYGIEIDGKIVGMDYLRDAVKNANDPTRFSFQAAYTLFSHNDEVDELIKKIYMYPEWDHEKRIKAFYAYVKHYRYVGEDAFKADNDFFARHCVMQLIFFSGRLILAHNHRLFPCHKALFKAAAKCENKPARFSRMSENLLKNPCLELMIEYYEKIINFFKSYEYDDMERIGLILENEWTWYTKKLTIEEW